MEPSADIHQLLAKGMGPALHWFPREVSPARLATVLVGMANTQGGTVLLGITPRSTVIQGIENLGEAQDLVFQAALLADPPLVLPVPRLVPAGSGDVLQVLVPAGLPQVYNLDGRYLWCEGAQVQPLPARQLRRLLLERGVVQFETQYPTGSSLDDLDLEKITAYLKLFNFPGEETWPELLRRRGCLTPDLRPTYAALALFGRQPQAWLPSATILATRFSGASITDQYIKQEITGTLPDQLRQAEIFINDNLRRIVHLSGLAHRESLEYPAQAVRELLVNAVAHRDYNLQGDMIHLNIFSDRLEVQSPGRLPGPVTLENLLEARFSRNAVIVQILADMGFIERLGYGLDRVVRLIHQSGLRPPRFEELAGAFRVTLYSAQQFAPERSQKDWQYYRQFNVNPRQEAALTYLEQFHRITNRQYQELCPDLHPETLRRDLAELVSQGLLIKVGDKKSTYYILKY